MHTISENNLKKKMEKSKNIKKRQKMEVGKYTALKGTHRPCKRSI
jgi:hypothetical protein